MSYTTNYPALRAEILTYVEDDTDELVAEIDNIIARSMDFVQRLLDLDMFRELVTDHVPFNQRTFARPGALKIRSLYFPDLGDFAEVRSYDFCRAFQGKGAPRYWCERDTGVIYLAPTPLQNYTVEIDMLARPDQISEAKPTNWLTDHCGDLVLHACVAEAEMFLQGPEAATQQMNALQLKAQQYAGTFRGQGRNAYTPIRATPQKGAQ